MDLASQLSDLSWGATTSPWEGFERNIGYGVMNLPFSAGDLLALRVFPRTDFGGYVSVWHRDRTGAWSQFVDRAPPEAGCPRVWGPALKVAASATIDLTWTGPMHLRVIMDEPPLVWDLAFEQTPLLAVLNAMHAPLPLATWKPRPLVAIREWVLRRLGLGATAMSGQTASGKKLVAVLRRMYWIDTSTARLEGRDLGNPVELEQCPTIGDWPLPRRGVFAVGEAHAIIGDRRDYERLRATATPRP